MNKPPTDWKIASRFVALIADEEDPSMCWQVFDDKGKHPEWAEVRHGRLSDSEIREWLARKNRQGCGIYVVINQTDGEGRRRQNIKSARAAWIDLDGEPLPESWPIKPHIITESSKDRFHAFWLIEPIDDLNAASDTQARLAAYYRADPKMIDPPRVCRVPGFDHHKKEPFRSRIIHSIDPADAWLSRMTLDEIADAHPCDYKTPSRRNEEGRSEEPESGWDNKVDVTRARAFLKDSRPSIEGQGGNNHAYTIACKLNDFGISPECSLELMLEDWNERCKPPWPEEELERIICNATRYKAGSAGVDSAAGDFDAVEDDDWLEAGLHEEPPVKLTNVNANNIDRAFALVNIGSKTRLLYWGKSTLDSSAKVPEFWPKEDFRLALQNKSITKEIKVTKGDEEKTETKRIPLAEWWLNKKDRYTFDGLVFDSNPEESEHDAINLWRGFGVEDNAGGKWNLMKEHIKNVIAAEDSKCDEYIRRWLAWGFQNPTTQAEVAIALISEGAGTGKGFLGRAICRIYGSHGLHISKRGLLTGKFNAHFMQASFLFCDEALWPGYKEEEGALKALITEPTMVIEPKGINAFSMPNALKVFMASNNKWVVPAGKDERRYAAFEVSEAHKQDRAYFGRIAKQLREGGLGAMLRDLRTMDLEGWHPRDNIPQTDALNRQKNQTLAPELKWLAGYLESGVLNCQHISRPYMVEAGAFYMHARRTVKALERWTDWEFAQFLDEWGVMRKRSNGSWRQFPPLQQMRARWREVMPWSSPFDLDGEWHTDT